MMRATARAVASVAVLLAARCSSAARTRSPATATGRRPRQTRRSACCFPTRSPLATRARIVRTSRPRSASSARSCEVLYANADGDAAKQQQQAESMLTQGVSVLVLDPFDGKAAVSIVALAKAQGVPVISYDRLIDFPGPGLLHLVRQRDGSGELQATALVERLAGRGSLTGCGRHPHGQRLPHRQQRRPVQARRPLGHRRERLPASWPSPTPPAGIPRRPRTGSPVRSPSSATGSSGSTAPTIRWAAPRSSALKAAGVKPLPPVTGQDAELAGIQRILIGDQYMTVYKALKPEA